MTRLFRFTGPLSPEYGFRSVGDSLYCAEGTTFWVIDAEYVTENKWREVHFRHGTLRYVRARDILLQFGREIQERLGIDKISDDELECGGIFRGVYGEVWLDLRGNGTLARDLPRAVSEVLGNAGTLCESPLYEELMADLEARLLEAFEEVPA